MAAGVLSAPVAIAVADENNPNTNPNAAPPDPIGQSVRLTDHLSKDMRLKRHAERRADIRKARAERKQRARTRARKLARKRAAAAPPAPPHLQAIAACESGGNPGAIGGGGAYRGKYQFDRGTWASVGGAGDPAAAPEAEQDKRAAILYSRAGAAPWPVCGR
jgi:hypothetical protein